MINDILSRGADALLDAIIEYYGSGDYVKTFQSKELADCVVQHAAATGASAMAAGILPGAGSLIATGIGVGAIWSMYIRICKIIKVDLGKNKLKALASVVTTNLVTQLAGVLAIEVAASFIPGASIIICGAGNFAIVYIAGVIFLNTLTHLFHIFRKDIVDVGDREWMDAIKASIKGIDRKALRGQKYVYEYEAKRRLGENWRIGRH